MATEKGLSELIDKLFMEMKVIKPAWRQAFKTETELATAKVTWCQALLDGGICTTDAIRQGLRGARADPSPFFPAPGQFVKWCWEWSVCDVGVPDMTSAWQEVRANCHRPLVHRWSHLTVHEAAARIGWWRLTHESGDSTRQDFCASYMTVIRERLASGRIDISAYSHTEQNLPDEQGEVASPETRAHYLREMRQILAGNVNT